MMIEFKYNNIPAETFYGGQTTPNMPFYQMKKEFFPRVYWAFGPKGLWFGKRGPLKPQFN